MSSNQGSCLLDFSRNGNRGESGTLEQTAGGCAILD